MMKDLRVEIESRILLIRGKRVMLDSDLAEMYGVATKVLLQSVKRNRDRFPEDFMFEMTKDEYQVLRSQTVTSKKGGRRYLPYCFTEQGVAMLSSVLKSKVAVKVNIQIMRAFVKIREMLLSHKDLTAKIEAMEKKYDSQFKVVFEVIRQLIEPPESHKRKIGFHASKYRNKQGVE